MKLTILGCGTSTGVPRVGNDWGACDPHEERNRRTRVSIMIETGSGKRVLVDTSPDLRAQLLANEIDRIDAIFWTHDHADHVHGIDDLRVLRYGRGGPIPGYASDYTVGRLRRRFDYVFAGQHGYPTIVQLDTLDRLRLVEGMAIGYCQMPHGPAFSTGYTFEDRGKTIGYATDFSKITDEMLTLFDGVDTLVVDCLRRTDHPTHASLPMALSFREKVRAKRTILSHLDKSMDYRTLCNEVPDDVVVGYDGLEIEL